MDVLGDAAGGSGPVFDGGCRPGTATAYLAQRGVAVSGVDLSPRMIEHARRLGVGQVSVAPRRCRRPG